jgi:type IV secretory pathway VirJ component
MRFLIGLCCCWLAFPLWAATIEDQLGLTPLATKDNGAPLVIFMSGDGGWVKLDKSVGALFQSQGVPVIGWSSLSYYWHKKSPEQVTADVQRILDVYLPRWHRRQWVLVGYSFGAEIVPFVINRLPARYRQQLSGAAMLSPSTSSDFEVHVSEIVSSNSQGSYLTMPEVSRVRDIPLLCLYGLEDTEGDQLCPQLQQENVTGIGLPGGHHFDDDYPRLADVLSRYLHLSH